MQGLGKTTADLARYKRHWSDMVAKASEVQASLQAGTASSRLSERKAFGQNPGNLRMWSYVPEGLSPGSALVVVLHGCQQNAAGFDHGTGWSALADRFGFAVLFPEQQQANNPNNCFNWFVPGDIGRDRGEALSIRQMTEAMLVEHGLDRRRVFVTGLSAGGAMTSVMLAAYPDVYAGGAIIAGLPYGCASNVQEALDCMFQGRSRAASEWGDLVRRSSGHDGAWPTVSVWHGSADATVKPMNAGEIVKQWANVHGLETKRPENDTVDGFPRQIWRKPDGRVAIESYTITGMAHGAPLATGPGERSAGAAGPFLLDVGISSGFRIAESWGLTGGVDGVSLAEKPTVVASPPEPTVPAGEIVADRVDGVSLVEKAVAAPPEPTVLEGEIITDRVTPRFAPDRPQPEHEHEHARQPGPAPAFDIGGTITKALRAAGLMKD
jgi:feruloyl esterase